MNRSQARELYLQLRSEGYNHDDAMDEMRVALTGGERNDPTARYWDALIQQESGGQQGAVSPMGAVGAAQVMPETGPEAAALAGREWDERAWRENKEYNTAIGRAYLRKQMRDFGDPELGLAAYNAGPGRVREHIEAGRPLPGETRDYVPAITGGTEKPMALSRDQARQYAQQRLAEGADMATVRAELQAQMQGGQAPAPAPQQPATAPAPAVAQQPAPVPVQQPMPAPQPGPAQQAGGASGTWEQPAERPNDIDAILQGYLRESWPAMSGDPGSRGLHAFARGAADLVRGGRQLWNELGSDPQDAATADYLRGQESKARQFEEEVNPTGSGINIQDVAQLTPAIMAGGMLKGPQIAAGALQGAAVPAAPGESRLANTLIGGGAGALADVAGGVARLVNMLRDRAKNTIGARDAIDDFAGRVLGEGKLSENIPTYRDVGGSVKAKVKELEEGFSKAYKAVESNPDLPAVTLLPSAKAGGDFKLTDEVAKVLTPKTQRLLSQLDENATKVSPIVDPGGRNITSAQKTTFEDVRSSIREIRAAARKMGRDDVSRHQLKRAEAILSDDLLTWGMNKGEKAREAYEAAKALDTKYGQEVVPFYSKKTAVGKYYGSEAMDERAMNQAFMADDTGMAVQDLMARVPGTKSDLRKIYGSKLREARGDVATIRKLESGTTGEALLSPKEREYLGKVAAEIYKEGGPAQHSSVMPTGLMRLLEKTTFSKDLQRMIGGLRPYGSKPPEKYIGKKTDALIRYLRSGAVQGAAGD